MSRNSSVQFSSVSQLCPTLCNLMDCNMPGLPAAAAAKLLQSCLTLCDPMDGSPPEFPAPGILQARTLEWVAISFFSAWKWKVKVKLLSHVRLLATPWTAAHQALPSMGFSRQEYWSGVPLPSPSSEARNPKSRCWQVWFLQRAERGTSVLGLLPGLISDHFYVHMRFSRLLYVIFPLCVSLCPNFPL